MKADGFDLDAHTSIGSILVRNDVITERELRRALKEQHRRGGAPRLGDIVIGLGLATRDDIDRASADQRLYRGDDIHHEPPQPLMEARLEATDRAVEAVKTTTRTMLAIDISPSEP